MKIQKISVEMESGWKWMKVSESGYLTSCTFSSVSMVLPCIRGQLFSSWLRDIGCFANFPFKGREALVESFGQTALNLASCIALFSQRACWSGNKERKQGFQSPLIFQRWRSSAQNIKQDLSVRNMLQHTHIHIHISIIIIIIIIPNSCLLLWRQEWSWSVLVWLQND